MNISSISLFIFFSICIPGCSADDPVPETNWPMEEPVAEIETKDPNTEIRIAWDFNTKTLEHSQLLKPMRYIPG